MVQTIQTKYEGYTKCEVEKAILACKAQAMMGNLSESQFKEMVRNKTSKHCPLKLEDITNAHAIFGTDLAGVHGKTVRFKPTRVEMGYINIPDDFHKLCHFMTLTADMMFINGIAFLMTCLRKSDSSRPNMSHLAWSSS